MHISLRLKLGLISLLLLALPFTGLRLSTIVQTSLLESREEALMFSARAVASALSGRQGLFNQELFHALDQSRDLYLFQLTSAMRINGKVDDWQPHIQEAKTFADKHVIYSSANYRPENLSFQHLIGRWGGYIYAIFTVIDDTVVYCDTMARSIDRCDHLRIAVEDSHGNLKKYIVSAARPGWVNGFPLSADFDDTVPAGTETRIQGVWAETERGYNIELRFPVELIGQRLAFAIADVDDHDQRNIDTIIGTANTDNPEKIGWLLPPSTTIVKILESLNRPQSKIQVVDSNQHIRASYGTLNTEGEDDGAPTDQPPMVLMVNRFLSPLYHLFTEPFVTDFSDPSVQPSTLDLKGVKEALLGKSTISSYRIAEGKVEVMAAITPLYEDDRIVGAVVVEQTTNSILALKNRVIQESIGLTLLILIFGGCGLLFFAFRISSRIRLLRDQADSAIGENGQILDIAPPAVARDEIGDLSRTLHSILSQLKAQGRYREKMADNLEHEMRTPLASISASLKNLAEELKDQPDHVGNYVNWALGDIKRLEDLLTDIRDATSLKNALSQGFKERFNLSEALAMWLHHSWKPVFADVEFVCRTPEKDVFIHGDPDRIRQMLDKLIENSVAFHRSGTAIELHLSNEKNHHLVQIINKGPSIPEDMREQIFNSMVSLRGKKDGRPHLGLGLYIVRAIAEHHGGTITASNLAGEEEGVCFSIRLPAISLADS